MSGPIHENAPSPAPVLPHWRKPIPEPATVAWAPLVAALLGADRLFVPEDKYAQSRGPVWQRAAYDVQSSLTTIRSECASLRRYIDQDPMQTNYVVFAGIAYCVQRIQDVVRAMLGISIIPADAAPRSASALFIELQAPVLSEGLRHLFISLKQFEQTSGLTARLDYLREVTRVQNLAEYEGKLRDKVNKKPGI